MTRRRNEDLAYSTARADHAIAKAERTRTTLEQLADRYAELPTMLASIDSAGDTGHRLPPGPRTPLRVDALSLIREIDTHARTWHDTASTALQVPGRLAGRTTPERTRSRIATIARWIDTLFRTEHTIAHDIANQAWRLDTRAGVILNLRSRAFAIADPCPECHNTTLWVDPETAQVLCTIPACGYRHAINTALLVHTTERTTYRKDQQP